MIRDTVSITIRNHLVGKIVIILFVIFISGDFFVVMHTSENDFVHKADSIQNGIKILRDDIGGWVGFDADPRFASGVVQGA